MIQTKERVVKHQVWVELAQEASWRTGWWGPLGEIPWRSLRLGERGQGNAQMGDLGSGLEVVKGPQAFGKGRMGPLGGAENPAEVGELKATDQKLHYPRKLPP